MRNLVIICVDDEETILNSLKVELKRELGERFTIETAIDGEEALELLAELLEDGYEVPLVISDYIMPVIKGDALLSHIHKISPKTRKIMLTGQADVETVSKAIKYANLYRYIAKPWEHEDLILTAKEAIRSYLQDKDLAEKNAQLQQLNEQLENLVEQRTVALRLSEEKFAKAFRCTPHAITITSFNNGKHIEVNDAFCEMIGYDVEEIIGKTAVELNLWVNLEDRYELFNLLKIERCVRNFEFKFRTKLGEIKTALLSAETIDINEEKCVISVSQDITYRKQAEIALQKAKETAEIANQAKSQFLAKMSHELRTPLNAILGFTQIMARGNSLTEEQQEYLKIINRSGEHLLALINDVLSMAKIESGQIDINASNFDLYQLLFSIEEMLKIKANAKGLQLRFERDCNVPKYIETDEGKLRQVLINLLGNSLKFTQFGSVILRSKVAEYRGQSNDEANISIDNTTPHQLERSNNQQFVKIIFEVEDTGPGISPEEILTLFKPFVQTETGRKSMQGTGLGLSISKQFIKLMGGDIVVNSQLSKGTTFTFDILAKVASQEPTAATLISRRAIALKPNQPTYRILIVEDIRENRQLLVKLLSPLGFAVKEAENGREAIDLWKSWKPHLIWMDIQMPVMNGYEATRQIKQLLAKESESISSANPRTIIIALTASAFEEEKSLILEAGCDDFLPKPFRSEILLEKLGKYLGVEYIYEEDLSSNLTSSQSQNKPLTVDDLSIMPREWIEKLHQAALTVDDSEAVQLIQEIPDRAGELANTLTNLVENFRMDAIFEVTEEYINTHFSTECNT